MMAIIIGSDQGKIIFNNHTWEAKEGDIFFLRYTGNIQHSLQRIGTEDATIITLPKEEFFFKEEYIAYRMLVTNLYRKSDLIQLHLPSNSFEMKFLHILVEKIKREKANLHLSNHIPLMIRGLMNVLTFEFYGIISRQKEIAEEKQYPLYDSNNFIKFMTLLKDNISINNNIDFFAEKISISKTKLNAICQKNAGQTPKSIIHAAIMNKAKELLIVSDKLVKEIAYELGFSVPTNFNKFFLLHEGVTPRQYRLKKLTADDE